MSLTSSAVVNPAEPSAAALSAPVRLVRRLAAAAADAGVRKGVLSIFDQAVVSGTSFATSVVIGRTGSPGDLGTYSLALSVMLFVRGIQDQLVAAPYMIYCSRRDGDGRASYLGSVLVHQVVMTALTLMALTGLAYALSRGVGPAGLAPVVWVLLGAAPFLLLRDCLRELAFAHLRPGTATLIDVTVAVLQLGGLALLAWSERLTVGAVYAVMGAACAAACLGWFAAREQPVRIVLSRIVPDWRQNWTLGRWALASQFVGCTSPYLMPWLVALARDEASTGMLAACTTLVGLANMFVIGLSNYLSPRAAHAWSSGGAAALRSVLSQTALLFLVALGGFCLLVVLTGDRVAVAVYGSQYAGCGLVIAVLAAATLINSLGITAGNGLWAMEKPSANFAADVTSLVVTFAAVAALVPSLGVLGSALATLAGTTAGTAVRGTTLLRMLNGQGTKVEGQEPALESAR